MMTRRGTSEIEAGLVEPQRRNENGDASQNFLWDGPRRGVTRVCPSLTLWLDTMGYDQAGVVRDRTHLCLYITCTISLLCTLTWFADVYSGSCAQARTYLEDDEGAWRCVGEFVGVVIFFGTLRDSIQMMGTYDSEHHVLLERKKALMRDLHSEVTEAMQKAKKNIDDLFQLLLRLTESRYKKHISNYFENTRNRIYKALNESSSVHSSEQGEALIDTVDVLVGHYLAEPAQLSAAFFVKLIELHRKLVDRPLDEQNGENAEPRGEMRCAYLPEFFQVLTANYRLNDGRQNHELSQTLRTAGQQVFEPVRHVIKYLDDILGSSYLKRLQNPEHDISFFSLCGCGTLPTSTGDGGGSSQTSSFRCCVPRAVGRLVRCLCCCCRCFGYRYCKCEAAGKYPKRVQMGCFWFIVVSRLHERLIQGVTISFLFCLYYLWRTGRNMVHVGHQCVTTTDGEFWPCMWELARGSLILLALLFHVPALAACLARIRDLDAIVHIMEDIRKLNDIRGVVGELERRVRVDQAQQSLLEFINQRVDARIKLVDAFRDEILRLDMLSARRKEKFHVPVGMVESLIVMLEHVQQVLGPAAAWVSLPLGKQKLFAKKVELLCHGLIERNFQDSALSGIQMDEIQVFSYKWAQQRQHALYEQLYDIWCAQTEAGVAISEADWYDRVVVTDRTEREIQIRSSPNLNESDFPVKVFYLWERRNGRAPPPAPELRIPTRRQTRSMSMLSHAAGEQSDPSGSASGGQAAAAACELEPTDVERGRGCSPRAL